MTWWQSSHRADPRSCSIADRHYNRQKIAMPEPGTEPQFCDHDCDDGCSMTEFPVSLRPYRCRHLSDAERRIRDIVFTDWRDLLMPDEREQLDRDLAEMARLRHDCEDRDGN